MLRVAHNNPVIIKGILINQPVKRKVYNIFLVWLNLLLLDANLSKGVACIKVLFLEHGGLAGPMADWKMNFPT